MEPLRPLASVAPLFPGSSVAYLPLPATSWVLPGCTATRGTPRASAHPFSPVPPVHVQVQVHVFGGLGRVPNRSNPLPPPPLERCRTAVVDSKTGAQAETVPAYLHKHERRRAPATASDTKEGPKNKPETLLNGLPLALTVV
ncbi:hypothetical protein NDU88_009022 [Pleurodeles waltl]|uniref:Uncharacterized protein n=1 Tax=Pleurodeles waltl TaxID=8319 RepID=A0AAV7PTS5_PLEWA|nr:hypothetical protein NDU88_009022 [Pleurodeles waltl]